MWGFPSVFYGCVSFVVCAAVFVDEPQADDFLGSTRSRRSNRGSVFEEFHQGNQERECVEEVCNYEEAFEVTDDRTKADIFWTRYTDCRSGVYSRPIQPLTSKTDLRLCLTDGDQCEAKPCVTEHTVACQDLIGNFNCICKPGFDGVRCQIDTDNCSPDPCDARGTERCVHSPASFSCECREGFDGKFCENEVNQCLRHPCGDHGSCMNQEQGFQCVCDTFYKGKLCDEEIADCRRTGCGSHGSCNHGDGGSFTCRCDEWFAGDKCQQEITDCRRDGCSNRGSCYHDNGGDVYTCVCDQHWFGEDCSQEITDCRRHGCSRHGECLFEDEVHKCTCEDGWMGEDCSTDEDECEESVCTNQCVNTAGSFRCECGWGYVADPKDSTKCEDVDECATNHGCSGRCRNTEGSYVCACDAGYEPHPNSRTRCVDVDECAQDNGGCGGKCLNLDGSFACTCTKGFTSDDGGVTCHDIDECARGSSGCQHTCTNTLGSYECACPPGHVLNYNKKTCRDVNECIGEAPPCDHTCINTLGSFTCKCKKGYELDSTNRCEDVDECETAKCEHSCVNTPGSYRCVCREGFEPVGRYCFGVNECESNPCQRGRCVDGVSSFTCSCNFGWSGILCEVDDSNRSPLPCDSDPCANGRCADVGDGFQCTCPAGYTGVTCADDVDECDVMNGNCDQRCVNNHGSYKCACEDGYELEGEECVDVDECTGESPCLQPHQECVNLPGSFRCACSEGYERNSASDVIDGRVTCIRRRSTTSPMTSSSTSTIPTPLMTSSASTSSSTSTSPTPSMTSSTSTSSSTSMSTSPPATSSTLTLMTSSQATTSPTAPSRCQGNGELAPGNALLIGSRSDDVIEQRVTGTSRKSISFSLRFRTFDPDGVLVGVDSGRGHSLLLAVVGGRLMMTSSAHGVLRGRTNLKKAEVEEGRVADGEWHQVKFRKSKSAYKLQLDRVTIARTTSSMTSFIGAGARIMYGGLAPLNVTNGADMTAERSSFEGCLDRIQWRAATVKWTTPKRRMFAQRRGCFASVRNDGSFFDGSGYLRLDPAQYRTAASDFSVRITLRSEKKDGVILMVKFSSTRSILLQLRNGTLVASARKSNEATSAVFSRDNDDLCGGLWLTIYAKFLNTDVKLFVDGREAQQVSSHDVIGQGDDDVIGRNGDTNSGMNLRHDSVYIGGTPEGSRVGFRGSVRRLIVNNRQASMTSSRDYVGVQRHVIPA